MTASLSRITLLAACLIAGAQAAAETFKIATLAPEGTSWMREMRAGAAEIASLTGDRVKFKFYPGGVMGNDKSVLRKIRVRQLQGGAFTGGGLSQVYPDSQLYSLPFLFRSYAEVDHVRARMDSLLRAGLERAGLVALGISEGGFAYMMCREPLRAVEDLKGRKVWLPEGDVITQTVFDVAGVAPVPLPLADVYTGLQTGLLDTVGSSPMAAIAFQWHTRMRYLTDVPLIYLVGILVVDAKAFGRLSEADRTAVRQVMGRVFQRLDRLNRDANAEARQALLAEGIEFVAPSPAELERWHQIADESVRRLGALGVYSAGMLEVLRGHLGSHQRGLAGGGR